METENKKGNWVVSWILPNQTDFVMTYRNAIKRVALFAATEQWKSTKEVFK